MKKKTIKLDEDIYNLCLRAWMIFTLFMFTIITLDLISLLTPIAHDATLPLLWVFSVSMTYITSVVIYKRCTDGIRIICAKRRAKNSSFNPDNPIPAIFTGNGCDTECAEVSDQPDSNASVDKIK